MKTIQEQNVFQFSSLLIALITVIITTISLFPNKIEKIEIIYLAFASIIFLGFILLFNKKIKKLNGLVSSFATTFVSYTFLVCFITLACICLNSTEDIKGYLEFAGIFLIFGYVFNLGISLVVFIFYKSIMYLNNLK